MEIDRRKMQEKAFVIIHHPALHHKTGTEWTPKILFLTSDGQASRLHHRHAKGQP